MFTIPTFTPNDICEICNNANKNNTCPLAIEIVDPTTNPNYKSKIKIKYININITGYSSITKSHHENVKLIISHNLPVTVCSLYVPEDDNKSSKISISSSIMKSNGLGRALQEIEKMFNKVINENKLNNKISKSAQVKPYIKEIYSEEHHDVNLRGKPRIDPLFSIKLIMDGTMATEILDYNKITNSKGKPSYQKLTAEENKPLTYDNIKNVIKYNSTIMSSRLTVSSVITGSGIYLSIKAKKLVIDSIAANSYCDDELFAPKVEYEEVEESN